MKINNLFLKFIPVKTVYAHCDIPCGIYDPHGAQMAAHTVLRMTQLLKDLGKKDDEEEEDWIKLKHDVARITRVKEEHGELVEHELGTLENDYFKEEHFKANPDLKETLNKAVKLSVKVRQNIDMAVAEELLAEVQKVAEVFYKTKDMKTTRVKAPYPTGLEIVVPAKG